MAAIGSLGKPSRGCRAHCQDGRASVEEKRQLTPRIHRTKPAAHCPTAAGCEGRASPDWDPETHFRPVWWQLTCAEKPLHYSARFVLWFKSAQHNSVPLPTCTRAWAGQQGGGGRNDGQGSDGRDFLSRVRSECSQGPAGHTGQDRLCPRAAAAPGTPGTLTPSHGWRSSATHSGLGTCVPATGAWGVILRLPVTKVASDKCLSQRVIETRRI